MATAADAMAPPAIETINPMAVLFTPNDFAKSGIAGTISPYPTATKKPTAVVIYTAVGNLGFLAERFTRCFFFSVLCSCSSTKWSFAQE